ncbi:MAG: S1C family serine protease [Sandaracinaceae bacterium]
MGSSNARTTTAFLALVASFAAPTPLGHAQDVTDEAEEPSAPPAAPAEGTPSAPATPASDEEPGAAAPAATADAPVPTPPTATAQPTCVAAARELGRAGTIRVRSGTRWGAGFAYGSANRVVTSYAVIRGGRPVTLVTRDGEQIAASVVGTDPALDLAVLEPEAPLPAVVPLAVAPTVEVGQSAIAVGHPFGQQAAFLGARAAGLLRWSATHGVVTGINDRVMQVDIALDQGFDGAPILDCQGAVIGVATSVSSLSPTLALVVRTEPLDDLAEQASQTPQGYPGDLRFRTGIGFVARWDEFGRAPVGGYLTVGGVLFDRLSWLTNVGYLRGGLPQASGSVLSQTRELFRIESLLGWRFFLDVGGAFTLHIVPELGGVFTLRRDSQRVASTVPSSDPGCVPDGTEACLDTVIDRSASESVNVRPAVGLSLLFGDAFTVGYTLEIDTDDNVGDVGRFFHALRVGVTM